MKTTLFIVMASLLAVTANAELRTWTSSAGKEAKLDLVTISVVDGEKVGEFKMENGKVTSLKQSDLSEEDAKLLSDVTPLVKGESSVFDEVLWNNLVKLDGKAFQKTYIFEKPKKYYVYYYTASWCGPCQRFTPSLVNWYKENKNDNFELFLISSDRSEPAMLGYAKSKKMLWPHLELNQARVFKSQFQHGVRGIPSLIVCTPDGKVLGNYRSQLSELAEMVKD